jgi:REP element-mobilizing transposase RayT
MSRIVSRMPRPPRIDFPGCVHHVPARGNRRDPIFLDDFDRRRLFALLGEALERFEAEALAHCLMGNHYHLVLRSNQANLSQLMRQVNSVYTHAFNRRHATEGHLFQGRFRSEVVDSDNYLIRVCCYTESNPVRAGLVRHAGDWPWSSYRAHVGREPAPIWLDVDTLYGHLLGNPPIDDAARRLAAMRHAAAVEASRDDRLFGVALRHEAYLGDDAFIERVKNRASKWSARSRIRGQV